MKSIRFRSWAVFFSLLFTIACSSVDPPSDGPPQCLSSLNLECTSFPNVNFSEIYTRILSRATCSSAGVSCHGADGKKGGLSFTNPDEAYAQLLGQKDGKKRVVPGDPTCSSLVVRLESPGKAWTMPVGAQANTLLPEAERCAIRRWIKEGALR